MKKLFLLLSTIFLLSLGLIAQDYTFDDFVGTWHGTISGEDDFGPYVDQMYMVIQADGFYTETSGHLMPTIYPNSQECTFDAPTNRMHWWYLYLVYSGMNLYTHFYYEVVYFSNDTLEMHYNYWDDPEPHPEIGTIFLVKENLMPAPSALGYNLYGNNVVLNWDEPAVDPEGYNVYHKLGDNNFELLSYTTDDYFSHEDVTAAGLHAYHITAVYEDGESDPSNEVQVDFLTPPPTALEGYLQESTAVLSWTEPTAGNMAMAGLVGYNIFHKEGEDDFELLEFVQYPSYYHYDIPAGTHVYYVTAIYDGGESVPSNEIELEMVISGVKHPVSTSFTLYPNPASEFVTITSESNIRTVTILTQWGQVMIREAAGTNRHGISVSQLDAGLYLVGIEQSNGDVIYKRLSIQ